MSHRFLVSAKIFPVLVAVAVVVTLMMPVSIRAQAPDPTPAPGYTPPRTPDGQPDLQGFWTNATYTPLERPDGVADEFYSSADVAQSQAEAAERESAQTVPGTIPDVHYDFTQFGLDRSQSTVASTLRTSLIFDPSDGKLPSITQEGERIRAEREAAALLLGGRRDTDQKNQLDDRCLIMRGSGPPMMDAGYNSNYQIVQSRDHVMILVEMIHDVRIIPLDRKPQPHANVRQWMGASRGHWEGDTLVVETANFNGKNPFYGSSEDMRVIERFTRVDDETIVYRFTVDDPTMWTGPWSAESAMKATIGPIFEVACHEGNYGLYNTLVGARLEEEQAREAAAESESN